MSETEETNNETKVNSPEKEETDIEKTNQKNDNKKRKRTLKNN